MSAGGSAAVAGRTAPPRGHARRARRDDDSGINSGSAYVYRFDACQDGFDNDGDTLIDFPDDPGCFSAQQNFEDPACDDGNDNDGDLLIDYPDDPGCFAAWDGSEMDPPFCGLGFELTFLLPPLMWLYGRRRRSAR